MEIITTIYRQSPSCPAFMIPANRQKNQENAEIRFEPGFFRADICSGHRKPTKLIDRARQSPKAIPWGRVIGRRDEMKRGAGSKGTMADSREVMNIRQASQYLGVSPDTLYKYVGEQKIPAFKLGNRWRFKKSKLDQWMEEKSMEMEPQAKRRPRAAGKAAGQL
jgi:excisionase family DNA binding protein